jgi:hypothetical protein
LARLDLLIAVAFKEAFDHLEPIGPQRLRAGKAAPDTPDDGVGEEQAKGGEQKHQRQQVEILRPEGPGASVKLAFGEGHQKGLVGRIAGAVPRNPRRTKKEHRDRCQNRAFDPAERACDGFLVDLFDARELVCLVAHDHGFHAFWLV